MTKRILFVDDEKSILNGLKRSLHKQQKIWDMSFILGGEAALELSKNIHFDAVVSDLRMPGMDGLELVSALKADYPEMIRIVLSAHTDEKMLIKLPGVVHQFLAKPCDSEILIDILCRTFAARDFLENEHIQSFVAGINNLPSPPSAYQEITQILDSPNSSLKAVAKIIQRDPAMTAKILQLVNSAFFGLGRDISDTADAVTLLGLETIQSLVLSIGIFSQFDSKNIKDKQFSIENLWLHSLKVADLSKRIALLEKSEKEFVDNSFVAGIMHEIGILILEENFSEQYIQVRNLSSRQNIPIYQAEYEIFGTTHAAVGAYLLRLWSLNNKVVEAVAFHHDPTLSEGAGFSELIVVNVADVLLSDELMDGSTDEGALLYLEEIGMSDRLEAWKSERENANVGA